MGQGTDHGAAPERRITAKINQFGRLLGRIDMREDPPVEVSAPVSAPPPVVSDPVPEAVVDSVDEPAARPSAVVSSTPEYGEYGPVASGETLWAIAKDWSTGTGMSINKVMIAIQRENPQAFMNNNINLLKRGAILRMPAISEVERISSAAAYNEVATQEEEFYESKGMAPVYSPSMPLMSEDRAAAEDSYAYPSPQQPESEPEAVEVEPEIIAEPETVQASPVAEEETTDATSPVEPEAEAEVETVIAEETPAPQDQLELVPPSQASELDSTYGFEESEQDGGVAVEAQALRENLARTEEDLITEQQQNEYLEERIRELEAQIEETKDANVADSDVANMEQRLKQERLANQEDEAQKPWYSRLGVWMLGLLILAAVFGGWLFSRRSKDDVGGETIQEIKDEAEELLRVLEDPAEPAQAEEAAKETEAEDVAEEPEADATVMMPTAKPVASDDEADFLDEESSDPEIQLDLARAYISMGDKQAAREILEEVASNGSEEQQAEAQKMLDLM